MASRFMTGPFVPVAMLNLIRAVLGIHHHRFNLSVKRSRRRLALLGCCQPCAASAAAWAAQKKARDKGRGQCVMVLITRGSLRVIGADGALIERRRQSGRGRPYRASSLPPFARAQLSRSVMMAIVRLHD